MIHVSMLAYPGMRLTLTFHEPHRSSYGIGNFLSTSNFATSVLPIDLVAGLVWTIP